MNILSPNNIRGWSIISGVSLLIMFFSGIFGFAFALENLMVAEDAALTAQNIQNNQGLFFAGLTAWTITLITDILVTLGFYFYLRTINRTYALLSGLTRAAYTLALLTAVLIYASGNLLLFYRLWSMALIVFGLHLVLTGVPLIKKTPVPRIFGYLLILAGIGYLVIHTMDNFTPRLASIQNTLQMIMMVPMTVGELGFGIWLMIRGGETTPQTYRTPPA